MIKTKILLKAFLTPLVSLLLTNVFAEGIHFEKNLTYEQVLAKAKSQHKEVFVDFFTTWCGPCKYMEQNVYTDPKVAAYFNERFISISVQMDQTAKDAPEVKAWYETAAKLGQQFGIVAYPTFLFLNGDGDPVHRFSGLLQSNDFIALAQTALDPEKQYYNNQNTYLKHAGDSTYLRNATIQALNNNDKPLAAKIGAFYLEAIKDPLTKDNLEFIDRFTISVNDPGFSIFLNNFDKVNQILGRDPKRGLVLRTIQVDKIRPFEKKVGLNFSDWNDFEQKLLFKYPAAKNILPLIIAMERTNYFDGQGKLEEFGQAYSLLMNKHGNDLQVFDWNRYAWSAFLLTDDKAILKLALKWSKKAVDVSLKDSSFNAVNYIDTYANLWYKLGKRKKALAWENKALQLAKDTNRPDKIKEFQGMIDKMERNERTW